MQAMDIAATRGGRERAARTRPVIVDPTGAHRSHPHGFVPDAPAVVAGGAVTALSGATVSDAPADAYRIAHPMARVAKRTLDIAAVLPLLLVLLLVSPFVALAIKATSRGPVLFRQARIGRGGTPFSLFKFRSMYCDAEERLAADEELFEAYVDNGFKVPERCDPRITPVGRILRKLSIDELPQALNVLTGHMSLVGPRPVVPSEVFSLYGDDADAYLVCKPGLTGSWQVSGRSHVTHDDRVELDIAYAEGWTLWGDLVLLLRTIPAVLSGRGAH
jgi:lipopolysaccharide/colanic/teichoic acid biosynthesis glycosyltransferase